MSEEMKISRIKNCPFCGSEPKIFIWQDQLWRVICSNTYLCGAKTVGFNRKNDSITAWEVRHESPELLRVRVLLAELVDCLSDIIKETEISYGVKTQPYDNAKELISRIKKAD